MKSPSINYNSEKKIRQKNFRGQIWGHAKFWGQAKIWVEAKNEARPTLGPGQANGARAGFIVCPLIFPVEKSPTSDCGENTPRQKVICIQYIPHFKQTGMQNDK